VGAGFDLSIADWTTESSPSRSDWRLSPDGGEGGASVPLDEGGGELSAGVLAGAGALGVSTALDEGASELGRLSVVDVVSDIRWL
jgi:hypothetical protein